MRTSAINLNGPFTLTSSAIRTIVDVVMPLSKPIYAVDGSMLHEIMVPKGTLLFPSIRACNTAKEIWGEDALEWRPERWLSPLSPAVAAARIPGLSSNMFVVPRRGVG